MDRLSHVALYRIDKGAPGAKGRMWGDITLWLFAPVRRATAVVESEAVEAGEERRLGRLATDAARLLADVLVVRAGIVEHAAGEDGAVLVAKVVSVVGWRDGADGE
jgi:hypothetical protein